MNWISEMSETAFTSEDIAEGSSYGALGPAYFASRRVCEKAMEGFTAEHLKPLVKTVTDEFSEKLWTLVEDALWSDVEINLQGQMWRMVDEIVQGILSDHQPWIAKRYALGERYDCGEIRKALALSIKNELGAAFHADLQAENERLRKDLEDCRKWR